MKEYLTAEERNELFQQMTRQQQRIHILHESLLLIRSGKFRYVVGSSYFTRVADSELIQNMLGDEENIPECTGCALGGIFAGLLSCKGDSHSKGQERLRKDLQPYFTRKECDLIESAFEEYESTPEKENAADWGAQFQYGTPRIEAILEHLLANKGKVSFPKVK